MDAKVELAIVAYETMLKTHFKFLSDEQKTQLMKGILEYTAGVIAGAMGKKRLDDKEVKKLMACILGYIENLD